MSNPLGQAHPSTHPNTHRASRTWPGRVLLVEDEPSVGELVRGYLQKSGYRVIWVRSGEEALVEVERHPVKLVLLDIGLPGHGRVRRVP